MRWLHNLLHWRCDRELAQREAIISALMPRYQPVVAPLEPIAATLSRQLAKQEIEAEPDKDAIKAKEMTTSYRWGVQFVRDTEEAQ